MGTKITLKQLSDEIIDLLGGEGGSLKNDIISNVDCGAAPAGTTFKKGETLSQAFEKLLRKDIIPNISINLTASGLKEIGTVVNGNTITLQIKNLNQVTLPINTIKFYKDSTLLDTQDFVSGKSSYNYIYSNQIMSNTTFKVELVYNTNKIVSANGSLTFVYASYNGVTKLSNPTAAEINALLTTFNKNVKNSKSFTWNNIILNDERFCYIYPKSFGTLTSIKDGNGFSNLDSYTRLELNLNSPINGDSVPYYIYLLTDSATGSGFTQIYS